MPGLAPRRKPPIFGTGPLASGGFWAYGDTISFDPDMAGPEG